MLEWCENHDPRSSLEAWRAAGSCAKVITELLKTITGAKVHSGTLLLSFEGYSDRNAVEKLRNVLLLADVNPADSNITEDDFHISQILGCKVIDRSGKDWGEVKEVLQLPSQDTLVLSYQGRDFLIPFVKHFTPDIDIASRIITADNLEELM